MLGRCVGRMSVSAVDFLADKLVYGTADAESQDTGRQQVHRPGDSA